jgi:conjugal transfer pilus assembly protein TraF
MTAGITGSYLKMRSLNWLLLFFSAALFCAPCYAEEIGQNKSSDIPVRGPYYQEKKWGWYWFEDLNQEQIEEKRNAPQAVKEKDSGRYPSLKNYTYEALWNMHPDDFTELTEKINKKAVQYPTEENLLETIVLNDIARRKSVAFAGVYTLVTQKHPEYNSLDSYPITTPGKLALRDTMHDSISGVLAGAKKEFGLVIFTRDNCRFCDAQKVIIDRYLHSSYQWSVKEANISNDFQSAAMAESMGVETVPAIFLIYRVTGESMPISTGVTSFDELRNKLYWTIRYMRKEVSPEQYFLYDFQEGSGRDPLKMLQTRLNEEEKSHEKTFP